nr:hypothetical protein [Tanacetum cinerariifolium]
MHKGINVAGSTLLLLDRVDIAAEVAKFSPKNKLKARGTLLMAPPDKHQLKFNIHKDAKTLMEAIEKRFGADLEEQSLNDLFNNLKIYEDEVKGSSPSIQNTQNIAFVSSNNADIINESVTAASISAPSISAATSKAKVSTLPNVDSLSDAMAMLTMRARRFLKITRRNLDENETDTIRFDMSKVECYNCHRRGHFTRKCRSPRHNKNKETTRRTVLAEVSTSNALVSQCSSSSSGSDNEVAPCSKACSKAYATLQTHYDNLTVKFRKSQLDVLSYKTGLESVENRLVACQHNETVFEEDIKLLKLDVMLRDNALTELRKKFKKTKKEINNLKLTLDKFQTSSKNLSELLESQVSDKTGLGFDSQVFNCQVSNCEELHSHESDNRVPKNLKNDRYKTGEGYHAIPPPYTRTFLPHKPDLVFTNDPKASKSVVNVFNVESSTNKSSKDLSKRHRPDAPIVKDRISDSEDKTEIESMPKQREHSFVTSTEHVKSSKESIKKVKHHKQAANLRTNNQKSRGHKTNWNNKACFILRMTHSYSNRNVVPTIVLTRSRLVSHNAVKPVPTAVSQSSVKSTWPVQHVVNKAHSPVKRPIHQRTTTKNSNFYQKVTTVKVNKVNVVQGNKGNADKALAYWGNPHQALKDKGVIDSGCSRHMTRNISFLSDFKEIDGGYVAFGGNPKGGKIFGKGKIKTGKLDFDYVYFVKELTFNLFIVSQTCNKKNNVLFTDTKCLVLSSDFKLPDENHVLLRVPRENNMYNVDLKNVVPLGDLTCLFAKATLVEVLVTKPHNKTPYELLLGRSPSIRFMRPFGCPVTILNTLDPLGNFDGKADEGFLVGYFVNYKAFRVFNSRARIVQETLHINFLENKPNVAGIGSKWLFDIDTLTMSMNYEPVVTGNQPNDNAGIKENLNACKLEKETVFAQQYVLLPLWSTGSQDPQNTDDDVADDAFDVKENENDVHVYANGSDKTVNKKHDEKAKIDDKGKSHVDSPTGVRDLRADFEEFSFYNAVSTPLNAAGLNPTNSTNNFNTARPSINTVSLNFGIAGKSLFVDPSKYLDDPDMPKLEDIVYSDDEEDVGAEADLSNLETNIPVSHIPTTRVHKDHHVNQIIGDLNLAPQTRSMTRMVKEQDLPMGKRAIGSKWVFRNKKDEREIVIRNKARLVAQGHTQEEGIDYDEVFAPVARIEDIRLFLAYASFMGFMVYQMDVKSAFFMKPLKKRPDIMFAVCACARFQVTPKVSHLHAVKRIFSYLKGKPHLGLWYPRDSPFNLVAYSDSDYARASLDRKSTTGVNAARHFITTVSYELMLFSLLNVTAVNLMLLGHKLMLSRATATVKKVNDDVQLRALIDGKKVVVLEAIIRRDLHLDDADGVKCLPNEEIFEELARMGYEKPPQKLTFYKAFFSAQWKFLIHTLVQCLSAKRTAWNEFSCSMAFAVICLATGRKFNFFKYIFDSMVRNVDSPSKFLMYPRFLQVVMDHQGDDMTTHNTRYTSPALTHKVFANMRRVGKGFSCAETPLFASMLKKRVKRLERKHKSKHSGFKRMGKVGTAQRVESSTDIVLETNEKVVAMDAESQGRINQEVVNAASKGVNAAEPTIFDDEDVTMIMAQTLIKLKAEKAKLLDEQIAQKLHDKEVQKTVARDKQEKANIERALELQKINMVGYKIEYFRGMTYNKVRPIFEMEYKKVQTLFKPDKDVQKPKKKRVADETLLQESFKKLKATEVSRSKSTQEIPSNDPKEMTEEDVQNMLESVPVPEFKVEALHVKYPIIDWEIHIEGSRTYWKIIRVGGIAEAYQSFEDMLKGFDREDLVSLWNLVKEKFNSAVPSEDKEKVLWVELKRLFEPDADDVLWKLQRYMHAPLTWKLYTDCGVHHVSSTREHDIFMLTEKDYPLSNAVMILMLSGKLQVKEDNEMARVLVMKNFMEANKPKSRSLDTSSK